MKTLSASALVVLLTGASGSAQEAPITIGAGRLLDGVGEVRVVYKNLSR